MQIKRLSPAGCEELSHPALPRDFPAAECKPFAEIRRLLEAGLYEPLLLTDDAGARLAYAWQVVLPGQRTALLDYFAVRCDLRGSGVGTAALQLIRDYYALRVQDLLLECEHPAEAPDPAVARRRIGFYLRAGARATALESRVFGAFPAVRRHCARCRALQRTARPLQGHGAGAVLPRPGHILRRLSTYYPPKGGMECEAESQAI